MLVTVKVMGKPAQVLENFAGDTVSDVQAFLQLEGNYTYNIGGTPATAQTNLTDGAYLVLAPSVKGAFSKATKKVAKKKTVAKKVVRKAKSISAKRK